MNSVGFGKLFVSQTSNFQASRITAPLWLLRTYTTTKGHVHFNTHTRRYWLCMHTCNQLVHVLVSSLKEKIQITGFLMQLQYLPRGPRERYYLHTTYMSSPVVYIVLEHLCHSMCTLAHTSTRLQLGSYARINQRYSLSYQDGRQQIPWYRSITDPTVPVPSTTVFLIYELAA